MLSRTSFVVLRRNLHKEKAGSNIFYVSACFQCVERRKCRAAEVWENIVWGRRSQDTHISSVAVHRAAPAVHVIEKFMQLRNMIVHPTGRISIAFRLGRGIHLAQRFSQDPFLKSSPLLQVVWWKLEVPQVSDLGCSEATETERGFLVHQGISLVDKPAWAPAFPSFWMIMLAIVTCLM